MNSVQVHLALTHVPVILSLIGLITLIVALVIKNSVLTKAAYIMIVVAGAVALPVFFSGEAAEEAIENVPGISEGIIGEHEDVAKLGMISIAAAGLLALIALFADRWVSIARVVRIVVLLLAIVSGGLMFQTARLGGQIRHTEITNGASLQNGDEGTGNNEGRESSSKKDDD